MKKEISELGPLSEAIRKFGEERRATFSKVLAKYYHTWYRDSKDSIRICLEREEIDKAGEYKKAAQEYFDIIVENWDAIEFFSIGDNAFIRDSALPEKFRGYK